MGVAARPIHRIPAVTAIVDARGGRLNLSHGKKKKKKKKKKKERERERREREREERGRNLTASPLVVVAVPKLTPLLVLVLAATVAPP